MKTSTFPIIGMSCAACAARVGKALNECPGIAKANVNFASQTAYVEYDENVTSAETIRAAVIAAGYDLSVSEGAKAASAVKTARAEAYHRLLMETVCAVLFAVPIMILSMVFPDSGFVGIIVWLNGRLTFIHASMGSMKVWIEPRTLQEYANSISSNKGVRIVRVL